MSEIFDFQALQVLSWNIISFLSLELESYISQNIRNILRVDPIQFLSSEIYFLKYKQFEGGFSFLKGKEFFSKGLRFPKYKKYFRGFRFLTRKKTFFLTKYKKFPWGGFFSFFKLGLKSAEFHFRKNKKSFLLRNYKKLFQSRIFLGKNIIFFSKKFWRLRLKVC